MWVFIYKYISLHIHFTVYIDGERKKIKCGKMLTGEIKRYKGVYCTVLLTFL